MALLKNLPKHFVMKDNFIFIHIIYHDSIHHILKALEPLFLSFDASIEPFLNIYEKFIQGSFKSE